MSATHAPAFARAWGLCSTFCNTHGNLNLGHRSQLYNSGSPDVYIKKQSWQSKLASDVRDRLFAHHFINLCTVVLLNISQHSDIILPHKVDSHTLHTVWLSPTLDRTLPTRCQVFIMHLPPIDWGQRCLARPYPRGLFKKGAARTRTLDLKTAASNLSPCGTHGQPKPDAFIVRPAYMKEAGANNLSPGMSCVESLSPASSLSNSYKAGHWQVYNYNQHVAAVSTENQMGYDMGKVDKARASAAGEDWAPDKLIHPGEPPVRRRAQGSRAHLAAIST